MRMLRRHLLWLAGVSLVLAALAGCGSSGGSGRATPARSTADTGPATAAPDCGRGAQLRIEGSRRVGTGSGPLASAGAVVWVARPAAGTVSRVSGAGVRTVRVGGSPVSLALANGRLWVAARDAGRVLSLNATTLSRVTSASIRVPVGVVAGSNGIWTLSLDDGALYRLDPTDGIAYPPVDSPVPSPASMAASGGELWVLGAEEGGVSPINETLERIVRIGVRLGAQPMSGLSASGSALWLGETAKHRLLRIDTRNASVLELPLPGSLAPVATAMGPCGLWVAGSEGRLALVDPADGAPLAGPLRVGRSLAALAPAGGGGVWASDPVDGTVALIRPQPAH